MMSAAIFLLAFAECFHGDHTSTSKLFLRVVRIQIIIVYSPFGLFSKEQNQVIEKRETRGKGVNNKEEGIQSSNS
jgi:hypothetical protein